MANRAISSCLLSSPIPLVFSKASLPPLRVTLTHFALSCYEHALRLPFSFFPFSGLIRHKVKPRHCRSSWRAFLSIYPLMLPSTSLREALLACLPSPPRNLPSYYVESTLSFPCSRSDPLLSRQGEAFAHLDSFPPYSLVLWTDGSVPFPFSNEFANCSLCNTEAAFSFSASRVCLGFAAETCAIRLAFCWSRQH